MIRFNTYTRIGMFVLLLLLPVIIMVFGIDPDVGLNEKRKLAPPPKMRINRKFAKSVDRYVEDHFGGRGMLAKTALFYERRVSRKPVVKLVLFGENGWLYYGTPQILKKYTGAGRLTPEQLETIVQTIEEQYRFCTARGIRYLLAIAPDKNTVYPSHLPKWLRGKSGVTPIQQLKQAMRSRPQIAVLDLSREIINEKADKLLYRKTDTHWTQLGAFYGYRRIAAQLSQWYPALRPMALSHFKVKNGSRRGGDLAAMIGEENNVIENYPILARNGGWQAKRVPTDPYYLSTYPLRGKRDNRLVILESADHQLPKAVVFADSFIESLDSFLGEHFRRVVFHRHFLHTYPFDEGLILREKPDVVILQVAERSLDYVLSKGNSPALKHAANIVP